MSDCLVQQSSTVARHGNIHFFSGDVRVFLSRNTRFMGLVFLSSSMQQYCSQKKKCIHFFGDVEYRLNFIQVHCTTVYSTVTRNQKIYFLSLRVEYQLLFWHVAYVIATIFIILLYFLFILKNYSRHFSSMVVEYIE